MMHHSNSYDGDNATTFWSRNLEWFEFYTVFLTIFLLLMSPQIVSALSSTNPLLLFLHRFFSVTFIILVVLLVQWFRSSKSAETFLYTVCLEKRAHSVAPLPQNLLC